MPKAYIVQRAVIGANDWQPIVNTSKLKAQRELARLRREERERSLGLCYRLVELSDGQYGSVRETVIQ